MSEEHAKVSLDLRGKNVSEKITFGDAIEESLTDNPNFPAPGVTPKLDAMTDARDELSTAKTAQDAAEAAAKTATETQGTKEHDFDTAMNSLVAFVEDESDGNAGKMESAGFTTFLPGKAAPIGELGQVKNLSVTVGDLVGEADVHWDPLHGASSYAIELSEDPAEPPVWAPVPVQQGGNPQKSKTTITGLTSGTRMFLRVMGIGAAGAGPPSIAGDVMVP